ncbi:MAG: hypothetical protein ACE37F_00520 [Nannocystaceae bacterium]|nr:hypothetical protein [bacterium]
MQPVKPKARVLLLALVAASCTEEPRGEGLSEGLMGSGGTSNGSSAGSQGDPATGSASEAESGDAPGDSGDEIKLDVAAPMTGAGDGGDGEVGCAKADFLFVIDNSGSMEDEQQRLVDSFPGFIATIQQTLDAQDYQVMVVDTDAAPSFGTSLTCINGECSCEPEPQCCVSLCNEGAFGMPPPPTCGGQSCDGFEPPPEGCPTTLGAGKAEDPLFEDCGFATNDRFMTSSEPDLAAAFECAALVGAGGDGNERPMDAMAEAVGPLNQAGQCNAGFVRDDAILVVTFITDESEGGSEGTPATWKQALLDAKGGNEDAIVVLGVLGDTGLAGSQCGDEQAEDAPRLREFADSFSQGQWESVCAPNYAPFLEAAVSVIDAACDNFTPEG